MSDFQAPAPKKQPESPGHPRANRDPDREQQKPTPELGQNPRFTFKDFASI
ncbi:hypothetical protein CLV78_101949 [Aliiruegeria haliotis]|uniref:Uncharacterized protein n=1 Tax=Aliiruegeria haliotis TaxID=1280846 RepID=A0A2T0S0A8_9RHOB|nr:hypothetical protein [Aliiruegeria haliotis]PRY26845.1 hypothetical protein CLV78_101949 [Aliiruegeria haliotis]